MLYLLNFRFTLTKGAYFHFFHGPAIYAFIRDRLDKPGVFPRGWFFLPVESGRVNYRPLSGYNIGFALHQNSSLAFRDLVEILSRPPRSRFGMTDYAPLGAGLKLDKIVDCLTGEPVNPENQPRLLHLMDLKSSIDKIQSSKTIKIRFDSPLLILRTPVMKGYACFDNHLFDPEVFISKVMLTMKETFPELAPTSSQPSVRLASNRMIRTDSTYPKKRLIGSRGAIELEFPDGIDESWTCALLLSGLVGVGKSTRMGQGHFTIDNAQVAERWPPRPAQTICERAAHPDNLSLARESMISAGKTPGVDDIELEQFIDGLTYRMEQYRDELASDKVNPDPLRGIILKKPDNQIRALAIPTMRDRFLQRAVLQELAPAIDQMIEDSSFAYRKGLSRANAKFSVQLAREEGFEYVFESDIKTFFDLVDWELLENRLRAYFDDDPAVNLIMNWIRAPVSFAGKEFKREKGLPQGAVISPLLANLYLDAFDEAMDARGFRMVRFADDFIILCRKPEDAERARDAVIEELKNLNLSISEQKSSETSFEKGFRFLGYLFCRSVILESRHVGVEAIPIRDEEEWLDSAVTELNESQASGWLSEVIEGLKILEEHPEPAWKKPYSIPSPDRRPVYITDPKLRISASRKGLQLYENKKLKAQIPWDRILEISIIGGWNVSFGTVNYAMRNRVPITFYNRSFELRGKLLPQGVRDPSPLALEQYMCLIDGEKCLSIARSLIEAKIHNQRLLARRQPGDNSRLLELLKESGRDAIRCESLVKLRGIEGHAAHAYFSQWDQWVAPDFKFQNRIARGAEDPVNVMLNFLYTQLFRICWLALLSEGLDVFAGMFHEGKGRYPALAADIQEPFRFLCERLVLDLIRRHRVIQSDFVYQEKYPVKLKMKDQLVKLIIEEWEKRLEATVEAGHETKTFRKHIFAQARSIAEVITGMRSDIDTFRMKW